MQEESIVFKCEDKFYINGHGYVLTGTVLEGTIYNKMEIILVDAKGNFIQKGTIAAIEKNRKLEERAYEGDSCGVLVKGFDLGYFSLEKIRNMYLCNVDNREQLSSHLSSLVTETIGESKETTELENDVSVEMLLDKLNKMTGLSDVKKDVNSLVNLLKVKKMKESRGIQSAPMSLHLVFCGNPGTGKTTIARILAQIYKKLGVLSKGQFIEVDRSGLVAGYTGQTALKVQEVVRSAMGGILFIDEAYALVSSECGDDSFGREAIDTLLKAMEDHRDDLIVIVAGYTEPMERFLGSNPGLRSRFNKFLFFEDYEPDELVDIFKAMCKAECYSIADDCEIYLKDYFTYVYYNRDKTFANGRTVRNYFETVKVRQANRLVLINDLSDEDLMTITYNDLIAE